jgi:hypothetical protein
MTEAREHATSAARRVRRRGDVSILTTFFLHFFRRVIHRVIFDREWFNFDREWFNFDREWFNFDREFGFKKRHISKAKTRIPFYVFPINWRTSHSPTTPAWRASNG